MVAQAELVTAFGANGPTWLLIGVFCIAAWRVIVWCGVRVDKVIAAHLMFTQKLSEQVERQNEILDSQSRTLAVLAETQDTQGGLLTELHKLSKEWHIQSLTLKAAGAEHHVHLPPSST